MTVTFRDIDGTTRLAGDLLATGGATGDVLTQQANGTYAPAAGSIQSVSVPVSNAVLKTLTSAVGVTLVAAPASGTVNMPFSAVIQYIPGATPFNVSPGFRFGYPPGDPTVVSVNNAFLDDINPIISIGIGTADTGEDTPAFDGQAMKLTVSAQVADGDGSIVATVAYYTVTLG